MFAFALILACAEQDQELVGMDVTVDGQRVSFEWGDREVSDVFVAIADDPRADLPSGSPIWSIECPGATEFAPNENMCIPATVTYGVVPDGANETRAPEPMSAEDAFWASAQGFDDEEELPYFRADVVFRIEDGAAVILKDGLQ